MNRFDHGSEGIQLHDLFPGAGTPAMPGSAEPEAHSAGGNRRLLNAVAIGAAAYTIVLAAWLTFQPGSHALFNAVSDALRLGGPVAMLALYVVLAIRAERRPGEPGQGPARGTLAGRQSAARWIALALAVSLAGFIAGRAIATVHEASAAQMLASPSPADVGYLISYPFLLLGILLLPGRMLSAVSRTRVVLDVLLVLAGLAAFSWYFVLGPSILSQQGSTVAKVVAAAYPVWDLMLFGCVLLLWTVFRGTALRRVALILSVAVTVLILADSIREYDLIRGLYTPGSLLDLGRPAGYMLVGLAAVAALLLRARKDETSESETAHTTGRLPGRPTSPRIWRYLLPYISVPAVVTLMIYVAQQPGNPSIATGVYIAGALLIELVLLHQYLDYRELIAYANRSARLESLAAADPVTGLPNHRTVVSAFDVEFERARRYQRPCTALFLDLDHFKALNDSYGHPAGDAALREFASVVRTVLRSVDILGRWGGEEFIAMLPETDTEAALAAGERIRASVAAHTFWAAGGAHLTCSVGVATYPNDADTRDGLIEMADRAMYAAKRLGRNQVRSADDSAVAALGADVGKTGAREEAALVGTVEALAGLVEVRDEATGKQVHDVAALAMRLALEMGLDTSEAHEVGLAGRLCDIGKVAIPDTILNKPSHLSEEEMAIVRKHAAASATIVSRVPALRVLAPAIRAHHERWDGSGYPDRLAGERIPLIARILAVADAYLAMINDRPYRAAMTVDTALAEIERCTGSQFDPEVVEALKRVLELEALSSGTVGVA